MTGLMSRSTTRVVYVTEDGARLVPLAHRMDLAWCNREHIDADAEESLVALLLYCPPDTDDARLALVDEELVAIDDLREVARLCLAALSLGRTPSAQLVDLIDPTFVRRRPELPYVDHGPLVPLLRRLARAARHRKALAAARLAVALLEAAEPNEYRVHVALELALEVLETEVP